GDLRARARRHPLQSEQAPRVEARDDHLAFRNQYAHDLAQDLVRIVGEFQDVRKHDEVDAVRGNREVPEVGLEGDRTGGTQGPARGDTGGTQQIDLREPVLQCVVAEDVGHHAVVVVAFAL